MNTVIPINGLAARLALREHLSEAEALKFVNCFFALIEQTLSEGEAVSIKGFGTFEIKEGKVVFVAEPSFAALVNDPFEMFSIVQIDHEVDFEEEEEEKTSAEETPTSAKPVTPPPYSASSFSRYLTPEEPADAPRDEEKGETPQNRNEEKHTVYEEDVPAFEPEIPAPIRGVSTCCAVLLAILTFIIGALGGFALGYFVL